MSGRCQSSFELPEACSLPLTEPSDLFERDLIGDTAPVIVGGLFRLKGDSDPNRAAAARLVVRDINNAGSGLIGQRPLALVSCDVSGPGDEVLAGEERAEHLRGLVDFFSKTLGTPLIVGPMTSSDSLNAIDHVITKKYPTVIISPSATSPALTTVDEKLADDQPGLFWRTAPSDELQAR